MGKMPLPDMPMDKAKSVKIKVKFDGKKTAKAERKAYKKSGRSSSR